MFYLDIPIAKKLYRTAYTYIHLFPLEDSNIIVLSIKLFVTRGSANYVIYIISYLKLGIIHYLVKRT